MFENNYPYTDFHELNLDWILTKIKEFEDEVTNIETTIISEAKDYTDEQITARLATVEDEFADFKSDVNTQIAGLEATYATFIATVNARLTITEAKFAKLEDEVNSVLKDANEYTNYAILQNNAYIIDQTTKALSTVKVINYFTGASVSIQEMFDYLAQFHLDNAASYQDLIDSEKTYADLADYDETYANWVLNGKTIIEG